MTKIILILILSIPFLARADGWSDSIWFEPSITCAAGAAIGYSQAKPGEEALYSTGGCLILGGAMYMINSYYQNKVGKAKDLEISKLREILKLHDQIFAQKSAKGDPSEIYSLRVQEVVPAQKLDSGEIIAPTIKESLILPNQSLEVGY